MFVLNSVKNKLAITKTVTFTSMKWQLWALAISILSASLYFYISSQFNTSIDENDYVSVDKIYESASIKKETHTRSRIGGGKYKRVRSYNVTSTSLVLKMADSTLWYINESYSMYWPKLKDPSNKGKTVTLVYNPKKKKSSVVEIAIDGKVIYDISVLKKRQEAIEKEMKPIQGDILKMLVLAMVAVAYMFFIRFKLKNKD